MLGRILRGPNPQRWLRGIVRHASSSQPVCHKLTQRAVVRVAGRDASPFLQGLITNDMSCLHGDCELHAMYALMLNVQGRVLDDLLLYTIENSDSPVFLVECDRSRVKDFMKLLKTYKIRKKVDMSEVTEEYGIWTVFPSELPPLTPQIPAASPSCTSQNAPVGEQYRIKVAPLSNILANDPDPRLRSFARRLVLPANVNACDVVEDSVAGTEDQYTVRRYQLGIAEGVIDMPPGASIPLENNAVFMNGVSFQKGCYIGQELTARTHHTGVIRKRIMPLLLDSASHKAQPGDKVENEAGKNVGKLCNSVGEHGLALLRIQDVVGQRLRVRRGGGDGGGGDDGKGEGGEGEVVAEGQSWIPAWWPRDADPVVRKVLEEKLQANVSE